MGFALNILIILLTLLPWRLFAYDFQGKHYIAEYYGCSDNILYNKGIKTALADGCRKSGVTILSAEDYEFEGGGYTCLILLSESHASIHTYPEHRACFIDLFTCGDTANFALFIAELEDFLEPTEVQDELIVRGKQP